MGYKKREKEVCREIDLEKVKKLVKKRKEELIKELLEDGECVLC